VNRTEDFVDIGPQLPPRLIVNLKLPASILHVEIDQKMEIGQRFANSPFPGTVRKLRIFEHTQDLLGKYLRLLRASIFEQMKPSSQRDFILFLENQIQFAGIFTIFHPSTLFNSMPQTAQVEAHPSFPSAFDYIER
jgi:hypothetical protein